MNEVIKEGIIFIVGLLIGGLFEWLVNKKEGSNKKEKNDNTK